MSDEPGRIHDIDLEQDLWSLVVRNAERTGQGWTDQVEVGRSDDIHVYLEDDFQSIVHGNAERTGQGGTDQANASAPARGRLFRIIPGTLTERKARRDALERYEWDSRYSFPKAADLADAGFFCTGNGDRVSCQYCGLELSNWEPDDDPFIEHERGNPECPYVKQF